MNVYDIVYNIENKIFSKLDDSYLKDKTQLFDLESINFIKRVEGCNFYIKITQYRMFISNDSVELEHHMKSITRTKMGSKLFYDIHFYLGKAQYTSFNLKVDSDNISDSFMIEKLSAIDPPSIKENDKFLKVLELYE